MLSPKAETINDPIMFISRFRDIRLVPSLIYTLRDLMISSNELDIGNNNVIAYAIDHRGVNEYFNFRIQEQAALAVEAKEQIADLFAPR